MGELTGKVRYCSITCTKASTIPFATCLSGNEKITSGSRIEKSGITFCEANESFSVVSMRVTTELPFISDPVAGKVKTAPIGKAFSTFACFDKICHGSPCVKRAAAAINFVPSSTEPPPIESKKVIFSFFTTSTAFISVS